MEYINKVELQGKIGNIQIFEYLKGEHKTAKFALGISEIFKSKEGVAIEEITWAHITAHSGDKIDTNLVKGDFVRVIGRLRQVEYVDNNGNSRWLYEILATELRKI